MRLGQSCTQICVTALLAVRASAITSDGRVRVQESKKNILKSWKHQALIQDSYVQIYLRSIGMHEVKNVIIFFFICFYFFPYLFIFFPFYRHCWEKSSLQWEKINNKPCEMQIGKGGGGSDEPFSQPTWAQYFVQCNTFCRNSWKEFTSFFHASFLKVLTRSGIAIDEGNSAYHVTELGQWAHGDHDLPRSKVSRAAAAEEQRFLPHGVTHVLRLCVGTRQVCPCEGEGCLRRVQERSCCTGGSLV